MFPLSVSPSTCSRPELTLHGFPLICRYLTATSVLYHRQPLSTPVVRDTTSYDISQFPGRVVIIVASHLNHILRTCSNPRLTDAVDDG